MVGFLIPSIFSDSAQISFLAG